MKIRLGLLLFCLSFSFTVLVVCTPGAKTQGGTLSVACISDPSDKVIYVSRVFDSGLSAKSPVFNAQTIAEQFGEYLKGKYDLKADPDKSSCMHGVTTQADVNKRLQDILSRVGREGKQIIEVSDWNYVRDETAIKESFKGRTLDTASNNPRGGLPYDRIYCVSESFQNTVYYTGPYPKNTNKMTDWSIAFFKDLQQKHSFKGNFDCKFETDPHSKLMLDARLAGARAGGKQVVNTGWRFDPAKASAQTTAPERDEDREPASRPAANQPTASVQQIANKLGMQVAADCGRDTVMSRAYSCNCLATQIHDYLTHHPTETLNTPTVASLLARKDYQAETCINDPPARTVARETASSAGFRSVAVLDCAGAKFVAALHANPVPSQAKAELDAAIKACR